MIFTTDQIKGVPNLNWICIPSKNINFKSGIEELKITQTFSNAHMRIVNVRFCL